MSNVFGQLWVTKAGASGYPHFVLSVCGVQGGRQSSRQDSSKMAPAGVLAPFGLAATCMRACANYMMGKVQMYTIFRYGGKNWADWARHCSHDKPLQ
eukprot:375270-Pelagomonas_calceolata.AAC.5